MAFPVQVLLQSAAVPTLTTGMLVVFGIFAVALVFFIFEILPLDLPVAPFGLFVEQEWALWNPVTAWEAAGAPSRAPAA